MNDNLIQLSKISKNLDSTIKNLYFNGLLFSDEEIIKALQSIKSLNKEFNTQAKLLCLTSSIPSLKQIRQSDILLRNQENAELAQINKNNHLCDLNDKAKNYFKTLLNSNNNKLKDFFKRLEKKIETKEIAQEISFVQTLQEKDLPLIGIFDNLLSENIHGAHIPPNHFFNEKFHLLAELGFSPNANYLKFALQFYAQTKLKVIW